MTTTQFPLDFFPFAEGQTLNIAPITVLLGYNDVGKTTILKYIRKKLSPDVLFYHGVKDIPKVPYLLYLLFEQPEKGLHPVKHAEVAEHLAIKAIENNSCFVIETHSENFVLRLRVLIAEGKLSPEMLSLNFVEIGEGGKSYIRKIEVDAEGELSDWVDDFFNEAMREVMRIREAQKNKTPTS